MSNEMKFEGWTLKVTKGREDNQIECRKTIGEICDFDGRNVMVAGQVLLFVALTGWKRNHEKGTTDVRLSMNNPCPMSFDELAGLARVAEYARKLLVSLSLTRLTLEAVTAKLSEYYIGPDHGWPIMLGKAGEINGVEQFIIYPKVDSAISQMNELFEGIGNVEVVQEAMGEIVAGPARPGQ